MECIILAGGLGTRLQAVVGAFPKCMASVCDKPFLYYLFQYLAQQQCTRVILSLGFKNKIVTDWLQQQRTSFEIVTVIESEPLGTGGAIAFAMQQAKSDFIFVLNGDTIFTTDLSAMLIVAKEKQATLTVALKKMNNFNRYGVVVFDKTSYCIQSFQEKHYCKQGYINAGTYLIYKPIFLNTLDAKKFSFEKNYLERFVANKTFYARPSDDYFIDIGIPEDYAQAQQDFKTLFH